MAIGDYLPFDMDHKHMDLLHASGEDYYVEDFLERPMKKDVLGASAM
jgi:hypothetical protein